MGLFGWSIEVWDVLSLVALIGWLATTVVYFIQSRKDRSAKKEFYAAEDRKPSTKDDVKRVMGELSSRVVIDGDTVKAYYITDEREQYSVTVDFGEEVLPFSFPKAK